MINRIIVLCMLSIGCHKDNITETNTVEPENSSIFEEYFDDSNCYLHQRKNTNPPFYVMCEDTEVPVEIHGRDDKCIIYKFEGSEKYHYFATCRPTHLTPEK